VKVAEISASDLCDESSELTVVVTSNEEIHGPGDGNTEPDWEFVGGRLYVRAERAGGGDGRIYTASITAVDDSGNSSEAELTVTVPHDKGKRKGGKKKEARPVRLFFKWFSRAVCFGR
jgi:hypothetical protein